MSAVYKYIGKVNMKDENHLICKVMLTQEQTGMSYSLINISGN